MESALILRIALTTTLLRDDNMTSETISYNTQTVKKCFARVDLDDLFFGF